MPSSKKKDGARKASTGSLKRKASEVSKTTLPKKKKRGRTRTKDSVSLASDNNIDDNVDVDSDTNADIGPEDADAELSTFLYHCTKNILLLIPSERLKKDWNAPIYVFFQPIPNVDHDNGRRFHEFICGAKGCKKRIQRYLDKKDSNSTSNLRKHAKQCWGDETVAAADQMKNATEARTSVANLVLKDGSITAAFEQVGKGKVTYSHRQHTKTEAKSVTPHDDQLRPSLIITCRAEIVHWVSESARPFEIVNDRGFQSLMKTGRPAYYIPSPSMVSCDVRMMFARTRQRIARILQVRVVARLNLKGHLQKCRSIQAN
jgi:hypothetical protein